MSQLNTTTLEAAIEEIDELAIGEEAPPLFMGEVMKILKNSTNEELIKPEEEDAKGFHNWKRLADTGVMYGAPLFSGPQVSKEMRKEKCHLFRHASKVLETQQITCEMPPILLLERMDLYSKACLVGEARSDPVRVYGANKQHIEDFQAAVKNVCHFFTDTAKMSDLIAKDEAIMSLKLIHNWMMSAIAGINGSPKAWDDPETGEVRVFSTEQMAVRLDHLGRMYLMNPVTKALQEVPPYTESTATARPAKAPKTDASTGGASSSDWEKDLKWPENTS
eukprot:g19385.t1